MPQASTRRVPISTIIASPHFREGYFDGLLGAAWSSAYEQWLKHEQHRYERGRLLAQVWQGKLGPRAASSEALRAYQVAKADKTFA